MTGIIIRLLTYVIIGAAIYFGIRRIINDWREQFKKDDREVRERDLRERDRPDVVELKKDQDGVFRPGDKSNADKTNAEKNEKDKSD
ncbi:hypothetical protein MNBD_ALPHA11-556 [hydrothermal vent metagenome]|uniref:Uncharacterized protein n=1 Tax=hydrothermal vent metagenome TaxID=652676 RepID=A0A3B0U1V0_9ZZZZ